MTTTIGINEHYRRAHSPRGGLAHYERGNEELLRCIAAALIAGAFTEDTTDAGNPRRCVRISPDGWRCGVVDVVPGTLLRARPARDDADDTLLSLRVTDLRPDATPPVVKAPAAVVDVYLYSHPALREPKDGRPDDQSSTDCEWEVVGASARTVEGDEPPHPTTMARNQAGLPGGTQCTYTSDEWCAATLHWNGRAMLDREDWS